MTPRTPSPARSLVLLAGLACALGVWPGAGRAQVPLVPGQIAGLDGDHASATLHHRVDGREVRVAIEIEIDEGWHLYHHDLGHPDAVGMPTDVTLTGDGIAWSEVRFPEPHPLDQSDIMGPGVFINAHEGTVVLHARGELAAGATAAEVGAELSGLTCEDDGSCVPYDETVASSGEGPDRLFDDFPTDLAVGVPGGPAPGARAEEAGSAERSPAGWEDVTFPAFRPVAGTDGEGAGDGGPRGLVVMLALAFLAGAILNVMPCVLPVISIKVLSFVSQAGEDPRRVFSLGLAFAAGILLVFLVLAALAAGLSLSWGEQFQSQWFLVVMIGIVFAFALSLFGVYELGVPAGVDGLAGMRREGLGDAFFKGMLATLLATPCSGPFLGSTLTWTLSQPTGTIFAIFTSLGLGMALPYVILTANPRLLKIVPRPGPWMETFKQAMGFVLLATVVYLMISLRQDALLFTVTFLVFVGLACWVWGHFVRPGQGRGRRLAVLATALLVAALGGRLSFVEFRALFEDEGRLGWVDFHPGAFLEDLEAGRSVMIDFTADWCPNCKLNEKWVYESEDVVAALAEKDVVPYKADITHADEQTRVMEDLRDRLGARSIPFMAIFPGDRPTEPRVFFDIVSQGEVLSAIESLPDPRGSL